MAINTSGILKSPQGSAIQNAEIIFEQTRTSTEVLAGTKFSVITNQTGNYSSSLGVGTYVFKVRFQDETQYRTVASNVIVTQSMNNYSLNQIIQDQSQLQDVDYNLLQDVIQARDQAAESKQAAQSSQATASTKASEASSSAQAALASKNAAQTSEANALASKNAAQTSEANALASKNAAQTSQTNAASSQTAAANSQTAAANSQTTSTTKATEASNSAQAALASKNAAQTSETNALASKNAAQASQTTASTKASEAATSQTAASTKAGEAAASQTQAQQSQSDAADSASQANTSKQQAQQSQTSASTSQTTATTKASEASSSAQAALASKNAAQTSQTNAANSQTGAATSQTTATTKASQASASQTQAQQSQSAAQDSAQQADTSASDAQSSQTSASTSQTTATTKATEASNSAQAALASKNAAQASETNALSSKNQAQTSQTNASSSQTAAAGSQTTASTKASQAATSQTQAQQSQSDAGAAASQADSSAQQAQQSQTSASTSQTTATTKASEASSSAQAALASKNAAQTSETNALASKNAAQNSQTSAAGSQTAASTSQTTASTKAGEASTSQTNAAASQTTASTKAGEASTSQTNAASSQTTANTKAGEASTSQTNAAASQTTATTKATEAANSTTLAQKWAANPENSVVSGGLYSALHYAAKAAQSAQTASGQLVWRGGWSAQAGSAPPTPSGATQDFYRITQAGTILSVQYEVGDYIHWDNLNSIWFKMDGTDSVTSVNGRTGAVVVTKTDVGLSAVNNWAASSQTNDASTTTYATTAGVKAAYDLAATKLAATANAVSATKLATASQINGTNFDGTGNITTVNWGTARTLTIGNTGKSVNGSSNTAWSLDEIGAYHPGNKPSLGSDLGLQWQLPNPGGTSRYVRLVTLGLTDNDITFVLAGFGDNGTTKRATYNVTAATRGSDISVDVNALDVDLLYGAKPIIYHRRVGESFEVWVKTPYWNLDATFTRLSGRGGVVNIDSSTTTEPTGLTEVTINQIYTTRFKPTLADIGAVAKTGDTMTGGLTFANAASELGWVFNTDYAKIGFKNTGDGDTDSYMWFKTGDNGNEYFKWQGVSGANTTDWMSLKSTGLVVAAGVTAPTFTGALAGNAATATKLATARTLTVGETGKTFDGTANLSWSLAEIGAVKNNAWFAQVKLGIWSAICELRVPGTLGGKAIVTVGHTRCNAVVNAMFLVSFGHSGKASITQLESHGYTQIKVRPAMVSTNNIQLEILDDAAVSDPMGAIVAYTVRVDNLFGSLYPFTEFTASTGTPQAELSTEWLAIKVNNNKVYHEGFKPTAADVGALPSGGTAVAATKLATARTIGGVAFDGTSNINLPGVNTTGNQSTTGNAATATKLQTARTIALTGDVTGSVNFDGSGNVSITTTVADDSHNHTIANIVDLQNTLDGKLSTSGKAADSDKLDGLDSSQFLRSDTSNTMTGNLTVTGTAAATKHQAPTHNVGTGSTGFDIAYNSTTKSLDFNFVG